MSNLLLMSLLIALLSVSLQHNQVYHKILKLLSILLSRNLDVKPLNCSFCLSQWVMLVTLLSMECSFYWIPFMFVPGAMVLLIEKIINY